MKIVDVSTQKELNAAIKAGNSVRVESGSFHVVSGVVCADGNSVVYAEGNSTVCAEGNSTVYADGKSTVYAHGKSTVYADGKSTVYAYGKSTVCAEGNVTVYNLDEENREWVRRDKNKNISKDEAIYSAINSDGGVVLGTYDACIKHIDNADGWYFVERKGADPDYFEVIYKDPDAVFPDKSWIFIKPIIAA